MKWYVIGVLEAFVTLSSYCTGLFIFIFALSTASAESTATSAMLQANNVLDLGKSLGAVQEQFEIGASDEYQLRNAFRIFYKLDAVAAENLKRWARLEPKCYVAHLGLGIYYKRLGDDARGTDFISQTPKHNLDEMHRFYRKAEIELRHSFDLTQKPYLSIFHLLEIAGSTGDRESSEKLLERANRILPSNALVRDRYAHFLVPRWGGSYEELDHFIQESTHDGAPESVILQLRAIEHDDKGHTLWEQGRLTDAKEQLEKALELGAQAGGSFRVDFLTSARVHLCSGTNVSRYCP